MVQLMELDYSLVNARTPPQYADMIHLSEQVHLADLWNITGNSQK